VLPGGWPMVHRQLARRQHSRAVRLAMQCSASPRLCSRLGVSEPRCCQEISEDFKSRTLQAGTRKERTRSHPDRPLPRIQQNLKDTADPSHRTSAAPVGHATHRPCTLLLCKETTTEVYLSKRFA